MICSRNATIAHKIQFEKNSSVGQTTVITNKSHYQLLKEIRYFFAVSQNWSST